MAGARGVARSRFAEGPPGVRRDFLALIDTLPAQRVSMTDDQTSWWRARPLWLREPLVHFFAVGALLFVVRSLVTDDPRVIVVTPGLREDLARRFEDAHGRKPAPADLRTALRAWERDEALFREARRRGLERDDPNVRDVLIGKMRAEAALEVPEQAPTEAELQNWLSSHRELYERPMRYHFEAVAFSQADAGAPRERELFERELAEGAQPASLGRPISGGKLTAKEMKDRIASELAEQIPKLAVGSWHRVEGPSNLWLVRISDVTGGLPGPEELRPRLLSDWRAARAQAATERVIEQTVQRYRFEEHP